MSTYTYVALGSAKIDIFLSVDESATFNIQSSIAGLSGNNAIIYADPFVLFKGFLSSPSDGKLRYTLDRFANQTESGGTYTLGNTFTSICSASESIIFAISDAFFVKSTDGGLTFQDVVAVTAINPSASSGNYKIYFPNPFVGFVILDDKLYRTFDQGTNWTELTVFPLTVGEEFKSVSCNNTGTLIIVSGLYAYYVSTDSGATWNQTSFTSDASSYVQKVSETEFYILERQQTDPSYSYHTTDGGLTFTTNTLNTADSLGDVFLHYYDPLRLIIQVYDQNLLLSKDAGEAFIIIYNKPKAISVVTYICGDCPDGYIRVGDQCEQIINQDPILIDPGTTFLVSAVAGTVPVYGQHGLNLMPQINPLLVPYTGGNDIPPTSETQATTGVLYKFRDVNNTVIQPQVGYGPAVVNQFAGPSEIVNDLWKNRLNAVKVWTLNPLVGYNEFCFTFCVNLNVDYVYMIGFASDNIGKLYIDDQLYIDLNVGNTYLPPSSSIKRVPDTTYSYWHVFPVELSAGFHEIRICGQNFDTGSSPNQAAFGAEIYRFPGPDPVQWFKNNLTGPSIDEDNLLPSYVVFSTLDQAGQEVPDPEDPPVYQCPGSSEEFTSYCVNGNSCTNTLIVPFTSCVYELISCLNSEVVLYTSTDLTASIGQVIKLNDETCWTVIGPAVIYDEPVNVTVVQSYTECKYCLPSYKLLNCKDGETTIYTNTDLSIYTNPSKIINIEEYQGECWQIGTNDKAVFDVEPVTQEGEPFTKCIDCNPIIYQLNNCFNDSSFILSDSDLALVVDKIISIVGYPGLCFSVGLPTCDCVKISGDLGYGSFTIEAQATGILSGNRNQYGFTNGGEQFFLSWNITENRWEITNQTTETLVGYSPLDIDCPYSTYWVDITGFVVESCSTILYDITIDKVYPDCECCITKSCN